MKGRSSPSWSGWTRAAPSPTRDAARTYHPSSKSSPGLEIERASSKASKVWEKGNYSEGRFGLFSAARLLDGHMSKQHPPSSVVVEWGFWVIKPR